jgi:hypothetical protein
MFHKRYYRLDEAAQKLGVDVDILHHEAIAGKVVYSKVLQRCDSIIQMVAYKNLGEFYRALDARYENNDKPTVADLINEGVCKPVDDYRLTVDVSCGQVRLIYQEGKGVFSTINDIAVQAKSLGVNHLLSQNGIKVGFFSENNVITMDDLVMTHTELTRLLALKAERDGKPTAEQLQQKLDEANARIAELEEMQAQPVPHNQQNQSQHLYPCLQPIADIIEAFEHNEDFVKYGQGIKQQVIEDWLFSERKQTRDKARHIKALITAHYNITT